MKKSLKNNTNDNIKWIRNKNCVSCDNKSVGAGGIILINPCLF